MEEQFTQFTIGAAVFHLSQNCPIILGWMIRIEHTEYRQMLRSVGKHISLMGFLANQSPDDYMSLPSNTSSSLETSIRRN